MATTPLPNVWHLRTVAEASSKACYVCYKPTTAVLITPDNKVGAYLEQDNGTALWVGYMDFFYICKSHLKDKGFASPLIDEQAEAEKRKKEAMDREIEQIKKEYEERLKLKKAKKGAKDDKDKKTTAEDESSKAEKERDDKIKAVQADAGVQAQGDEGPRIFVLQKTFYQMRVDRLRNIAQQKMTQQRLAQKDFFPSVPKGDIA
ncbi:hypothetical protein DV737_g116, partial [Chaetothyriales sp. CBS 132003]